MMLIIKWLYFNILNCIVNSVCVIINNKVKGYQQKSAIL